LELQEFNYRFNSPSIHDLLLFYNLLSDIHLVDTIIVFMTVLEEIEGYLDLMIEVPTRNN
jgi:hypothetical protein